MSGTSEQALQDAWAWCVEEYAKRREHDRAHPSHLAGKILQEADKRFGLEMDGVEGWTDESGREGVSYLNAGDSYAGTICVRTNARAAHFEVSDYATEREAWESEHGVTP